MKKILLALLAILLVTPLSACSLSLLGEPTALPTAAIVIPSPTPLQATPTSATPQATPTVNLPSPTPGGPASATPTTGSGNVVPGTASGPYAVILVAPGDVLNVRAAAGTGSAVTGSFAATETGIMRTGPSTTVDGDLWVEIQKSSSTGWVNAKYLTEYLSPASFCTDTRVNTLITSLGTALTSGNGEQLSGLVSPAHGMTVYLWRNGNPITFKASDARWVFESTFSHDWGMAPASGLETTGSFHEVVLPDLTDVFNAVYSLTCNSLGTAPQYGTTPWPELYANVNYYTVYKPGTPGIDVDWRYWLVGVEYVQGKPYVFALIHFQWEP